MSDHELPSHVNPSEREPNLIEITSADGEVILRQYRFKDRSKRSTDIDYDGNDFSDYGVETAGEYPAEEEIRGNSTFQSNPNRLMFEISNNVGETVGTINLTPEAGNEQRGELNYYLDFHYRGHGYMSRAVAALSDYAFANLGYETLYGKVYVGHKNYLGNETSMRMLQRVGYTETGSRGDTVILTRQK